MTRETKVGVAVACSFLGLVASVVVLRMGHVGDSPSTADASEPFAKSNSSSPAPDQGIVPGKPSETGILQTSFPGNLLPVPETKVPAAAQSSEKANDNLPSIPSPPPTPAPPDISAWPVVPAPVSAPSQGPGLAEAVSRPPPVVKNVPGSTSAQETAASRTKTITDNQQEEDRQKRVENELIKQKQLAASTQPSPPPAKETVAAPSVPAAAPPAVAVAQAKEAAPLPAAAKGPAVPEVPKAEPSPPAPDLSAPPPPSPIGKEDNLGPPPVPSAPDITLKGPIPAKETQPASSPPAENPASPPTAVALGPKAPESPLGEHSRPLQTNGEAQTPRPPQAAPPPPVGAPPTGSSAPIPLPAAPAPASGAAAAKVQSYDTETHLCKPGENTFPELSKSIYGSEKYAQALLQFNREHPLVGDSFRDSSPRLKPGQPVVVPPTWVLEQERYAAPPPRAGAAPSPAVVPPPAPAAAPSLPAAAPSAAAAPAISRPAPNTAAGGSPRTYTVRGNGEMLFEIARQALGDGKRWSEIYRLNPDIRPELAIPGGTQLRLPADARSGS